MYFNDITNILTTDFSDSLTWYLIKDVKNSYGYLSKFTYLFSLPYNGSIGSLPLISSDRHKYMDITEGDEVIGLGSIHITTTDRFLWARDRLYQQSTGLYHKKTNFILFKNEIYECKLTKDFFVINPHIFQDISKEVNRDRKINKLTK